MYVLILLLVITMISEGDMLKRVAVITGANKGIGFEIANKIGEAGFKTIIACRSDERGISAANELHQKGYDVEYRQCDIASEESIKKFAESLQQDYDRIDVLVNNAAVAFKSADTTPFRLQARPTISVNFFGTLSITHALLPLLHKSTSPRIVNVASMAGHLSILRSQDKVEMFTNPSLTVEQLVQLMTEFVNDVESSNHQAKGWPNTCYGMSKLGVIALTKILAREIPNMMITACCPGYCATDMSSHLGNFIIASFDEVIRIDTIITYIGHRSAEMGARTPAWLAMLPPAEDPSNSPSGKFFSDLKEIEW
jgi:carbonyl reductase 1